MKNTKIAAFLCLVSSLLSSHVQAQSVTPLQLKVMQTRTFKKPPLEVMLAIKTFCEDRGATQVLGKRPAFDQQGQSMSGTGIIECLFPAKLTRSFWTGIKNENKIGQIKGEALRFDQDSITLRLRIFGGIPAKEQFTDPEEYNRLFNEIGNTIFSEAIAIEPTEQQ